MVANIKQDKQSLSESYQTILEKLKYIPKKNLFERIGQEKEKMLNRMKEKITTNSTNKIVEKRCELC